MNNRNSLPRTWILSAGLAALLVNAPLYAAEFLLTPLTPRALESARLRDKLSKSLQGLEAQPLFSEAESQAILRMGDPRLAQSLKVRTRTSVQDSELRRQALRSGWSADLNHKAEFTASLESLQWGLQNQGEAQKLTLSETRTLMIPGKPGEDVGVTRAAAPRNLRKVTVAVLDTGVDGSHPDLAGQILRPPVDAEAPVPTDALDAVRDDIGHGTHVAGIIAAQGKVIGVAPMTQILPVKVIRRAPNAPIRPQDTVTTKEGAFADDIARGILYSVRQGAQILNLSLAWPKAADAEVLRRMVALARAQNVLIVSAAGNDASQGQVFPCSYDGVVCVAAHGPDGALSHFTNYGASADVAAPGLAILSAWPLKKQPSSFTAFMGYELKNGSSMAAPFVSGLLARLLSDGFSPAEARARLLLGARPVNEPTWENKALLQRLRKWISHGNADLARSLELSPQPLFEPASKAPIELTWGPRAARGALTLPLRLELKNSWAEARGSVSAKLRLLPWEGSTPEVPARLKTSSWKTLNWKADEVKTLETQIEVQDSTLLESRFILEAELTQTGSGLLPQKIRVPIQLSRQMSSEAKHSAQSATAELTAGKFEGAPLSLDEFTELRSITPRDGDTELEFFAIRSSAESSGALDEVHWSLQRLTRVSSPSGELKIQVSAPTTLRLGQAKAGLSLYQIDRIRATDGSARYAFVTLLGASSPGSAPPMRITIVRASGEVDQVIEHDNAVSAVPDSFRWMSSDGSALPRPAWIGAGTTPPLEKKAFNPWDPKPTDLPERRFYYLAQDGIRSIQAPDTNDGKAQDWIALLQPTADDLKSGRLRALLASGKDYRVSYSVAHIRNARIESVAPLEVSPFRMLDGLPQTGRIQALSPEFEGTFYSGAGTLGSLRTTLLDSSSNSAGGTDLRQDPVSALDSVMSTLGVFAGSDRVGSFVETHTSLQYHDHLTGEVALTSLGRYSFLPTFIFSQTYYPVISAGGVPTLLIPSELGASDGVGIVYPTRTASGQLQLSRPALTQWDSGPSCSRIGNPIRDKGETRIAWICASGWWEVSF